MRSRVRGPAFAATRLRRHRLSSFFVSWNRRGLLRPASYAIAASGAFRLLPRLRARYRAVSITWPDRLRWSSLLVRSNPRGLLRPAGAAFGRVGLVWMICGCSGAPQAAKKIQDRTCVLILEHWYLEITTLILHTGGTLQKTVFNSKRHKIS